jgi:hypothetical protein
MPISVITSVAAFGFVGLVFLARRLFDAEKGIQVRWEGAPRHLCAIAGGLCAFIVLFALLQMLDLFESDLFSWGKLLDILQISFVLLVGGGTIIAGALIFTR